MYIARFCIESARAGVTAFDHYILGDCLFNNSYIHTMGLWMYRSSNTTNPEYISWAAHPEYYFYQLICRFATTGSYCQSLELIQNGEYDDSDVDVKIVAFSNPDGSSSYYIANKSNDIKKVAIVNQEENSPKKMDCYRVTEARIPSDRNCDLIESYMNIDTSDGVAYLGVPANGFVVITNMGKVNN